MKYLIQYAEFVPGDGIRVGNMIFEGTIVEICGANPNIAILDTITISEDELKLYNKAKGIPETTPHPAPLKKVRPKK